jgi:hypothetical protein
MDKLSKKLSRTKNDDQISFHVTQGENTLFKQDFTAMPYIKDVLNDEKSQVELYYFFKDEFLKFMDIINSEHKKIMLREKDNQSKEIPNNE